jgi:hypothetical protein
MKTQQVKNSLRIRAWIFLSSCWYQGGAMNDVFRGSELYAQRQQWFQDPAESAMEHCGTIEIWNSAMSPSMFSGFQLILSKCSFR